MSFHVFVHAKGKIRMARSVRVRTQTLKNIPLAEYLVLSMILDSL
jgi:uncharacterized protein with GYD domain